jgi:DinB superfamily
MAETVEQYMERILGNVDRDPVAIQAATKQTLDRLIANVPVEKLKRRPSPDRWSIAEIVAHLLDAEIVAAFRIRMILSEPGSVITAYDQDKWAEKLDYKSADPVQGLKQFGVLREMNVAVLSKLTEEEWERFGMHEERGKETLRQMVRMYAGHDVNHLKQIDAMVKAL